MIVKGTATALAAGSTKFTNSSAVYVFNTGSAGVVTVRNSADDGNIGTIYVGAGAGLTIHLNLGEGLRGATSMYGSNVAAMGV